MCFAHDGHDSTRARCAHASSSGASTSKVRLTNSITVASCAHLARSGAPRSSADRQRVTTVRCYQSSGPSDLQLVEVVSATLFIELEGCGGYEAELVSFGIGHDQISAAFVPRDPVTAQSFNPGLRGDEIWHGDVEMDAV